VSGIPYILETDRMEVDEFEILGKMKLRIGFFPRPGMLPGLFFPQGIGSKEFAIIKKLSLLNSGKG